MLGTLGLALGTRLKARSYKRCLGRILTMQMQPLGKFA